MGSNVSCPQADRLQELLDGTLVGEQRAELTLHLDTCQRCRQTLDELANVGGTESVVARRLSQPPPAAPQVLREVIEELKESGSDPATHAGPAAADEISLAFLSPSDKPECIGRLGHYAVKKVIGHGGMGVVLEAFDEKLHRVVAIKVMAAQLATTATARKRFIREARAGAAVRHENVIDIHAVEESGEGGLPYLVMEYISGESLEQRLDRSGPLALKEILRIGMQTAAGLAAAHAQGLMHRDIKPANILLENGVERVKITDFGLARAIDDASLSQSGVVAGTPMYMAPEQASGEPVDHRADLFSLGSVLYAMCTGRAPFRASGTLAVLKRVSEDTPHRIRGINPEIPNWLEEIIERLHAKDPAGRFQSAAEVAELLSQHLAHLQQPLLVPMPGPSLENSLLDVSRDTESPRPRNATAGFPNGISAGRMIAAALLLAITGLGLTESTGVTQLASTVIRIFTPDGTLVVQVDDPDVKVTIDGEEVSITGAGVREVRLRPGQYRLLATKDGNPLKNEFVTITKGDKQVVKVSLEPVMRLPVVPSLRFTPPPLGPLDRLDPANIPAEERFPWQPKELVQVMGQHRQRHWGEVLSVAYSPDETRIASGGMDNVIRIWDAATLREQTVLVGHHARSNSGYVRRVAFSHDGRGILSAGWDSTLRLWNLENGKELRRLEPGMQVTCVSIAPNGRPAFFGGDHQGLVRLWDPETGQEVQGLAGHTHTVTSVAVSRDGRRVLSGSADNTLRLWDLETRKELRRLGGHTGLVSGVAFSLDGRHALSVNSYHSYLSSNQIPIDAPAADYTLRWWDLETGEEVRRFSHPTLIWDLALSPDGGQAAFASHDGTLRLWSIETGTELRRFEGHTGPVPSLAFSPDGSRIVSGSFDGSVRCWNVENGEEVGAPAGPTFGAWNVAFSPDLRHVISGGGDKLVRVWDVESGKEVRRFEGHTDPVHDVAVSPDGRRALSASCSSTLELASFPHPSDGDRSGPWRLWDVENGREIRRLYGAFTPWVASVAFSPDGRRALTGSGVQVLVWDVESGRELGRLEHDGLVTTVAFSPDGLRALSGSFDQTARLWDLDRGTELQRVTARTAHVSDVAFSPDGRQAACGIGDGTVRLWDLTADKAQARILPTGHEEQPVSLAYAPDGKTLASAGEDGWIILWDLAAGDKLREWRLAGPVHGVAFAGDGRHLATANGNGTVYILRLAVP